MEEGLIQKYRIERTDGTPINPSNEYFVLKVNGDGDKRHIEACRKAVLVYANEIADQLPELSKELKEKYS